MSANEQITEKLRLERETCSRCGGTGHYSYCQMYGTTCFKCGGRKEVLTKRGTEAMKFLKELRSKTAGEVKVGDTIKMGSVTMGEVWVKVEKIEPYIQEGASLKDGVMVPYCSEMIRMEGTYKGTAYSNGVSVATRIEILLSKDEQLATLRQAVEYQNTLTKQGTPRKR